MMLCNFIEAVWVHLEKFDVKKQKDKQTQKSCSESGFFIQPVFESDCNMTAWIWQLVCVYVFPVVKKKIIQNFLQSPVHADFVPFVYCQSLCWVAQKTEWCL